MILIASSAFSALALLLTVLLALSLRRAKRQLRLVEARLEGLAEEQTEIGRRAVGSREKVAAEMRVLQKLLVQLSTHRERQAGPAVRPATGAKLPAPAAPALDEAEVLEVVRTALNEEKVDLFLQPIVSLPQRRRRYFECFSRIRGTDGNWIMPEQYLEIAKRAGLMGAIDNMLLFRCIQLTRRTRKGKLELGYFCNISGYSLADESFFRDFLEFLGEYQELAQGLYFEFSQSDLTTGLDHRDQLRRLANLGYRLSLDQVTNLDIDIKDLASLGFKFLKVDAAHLLGAIKSEAVDMAEMRLALDRSGVDLIVEKVESEDRLLEVLECRPDYGQGFLFGEPRLSAEVT
ncbi:MAG: EAL domain-containing protein [Alphaproteobacteria bacterium]|nr:EAL domain-containing protein [Alphaproteobacteria bacterium]